MPCVHARRDLRVAAVGEMNPKDLELLVTREMPFGMHKGRIIANLPGNYPNWFARKGFPKGLSPVARANPVPVKRQKISFHYKALQIESGFLSPGGDKTEACPFATATPTP